MKKPESERWPIAAVLAAALFSTTQMSFAQSREAGATAGKVPLSQDAVALPHHPPAAPPMTEEQALHALEVELSRSVGKQISKDDFPEEARRWSWSGTTLVRVLMGADGSMKDVSVRRSSGFRALDEQALRVVRRIAAPPMPERLRGREVAVTVPIGFYFGTQ